MKICYEIDDSKASEVESYWKNKLPVICMEELAELQLAISKHERYGNIGTYKNLKEEIRDVIISISAYSKRFGIRDDEINKMIEEKLSRRYG